MWHLRKSIHYIFLVLLSVLEVFLLYITISSTMNGIRTKSWPTTSGIILKSTLTDASKTAPLGWEVSYRYCVGSNEYVSARDAYGTAGNTYLKTFEKFLRHQEGTSATVYYNPKDPSMAVLEPGVRQGGVLYLLIIIVLGLWVLIYFLLKEPSNKKEVLLSILVLFFAVWGVCMIFFSVRTSIFGLRSKSWPKTTGVILDSRYDGSSNSRTGSRSVTWHTIYQYRVGTNDYLSERVSFGTDGDTEKNMHDRFERNKVGTSVDVFYNPSKPAMAVLEQGIRGGWLIYLTTIAVCGSFLFVCWFSNQEDFGHS